ncbi:hypothetical protein ES319_A10G001800v1 [Gossypium barbadense]|uniref:F-box domain-containing protein n=1 Tax=Gossypium barbadense TaxID=3634 RepID=A0A5J5TX82_GOSBA|nr:hypothetical protein ES319_A10G001800v1 [Gossypium barbadense]
MCYSKAPKMNNSDVMSDILLRLPLKDLVGCKCVCKWWNTLISDPIFKLNYSLRNPQYNISGFFLQKFLYLELHSKLLFFPCEGRVDAAPKPSLSFIEDDKGVRIQHSCNGLLICSSFRCGEEDRKYYICSWKPSGKPFTVPDEDMLFNRGVFWNGSLHWIGMGNLALRFDPETELMLTMPMPPTQRKLGYFGESGGHLLLVEAYGPLTAGFDIMEMKADYSGWFVKYHLNLDQVARRCQAVERANRLSILHIVYNHVEDVDESFIVIHVPGEFVSFKLRDYSFMDLQTNNHVDSGLGLWYSWEGVYPYTNTFFYL